MAEIKNFPDTRLNRSDYKNRIFDSVTNFTIFLSVFNVLLVFFPIAVALFFALYVLVILWISIVAILITVGMIFTIENNIVVRLWSSITNFTFDNVMAFQKVACPIALIALAIFLLIVIGGSKGKLNKKRYVTTFVVGLILLAFSAFFYFIGVRG